MAVSNIDLTVALGRIRLSYLSFHGLTAVVLVQRYIARPAPEVLLTSAIVGEVASLAEGLRRARMQTSSVVGHDTLNFCGYLGSPAVEFLSWRALGRLGRAARSGRNAERHSAPHREEPDRGSGPHR